MDEKNEGSLPVTAGSELSDGLGRLPRCQHDEMGAGFRCTSCGKELVLLPPALAGARAREHGHPKGTNPYQDGTHDRFSWDCGWEEEGRS